jgi:hypothetical protein
MSYAREPTALVRHAIQAGDWRLAELVAQMISGEPSPPPTTARRAYQTLIVKLGLAGGPGNYDRV